MNKNKILILVIVTLNFLPVYGMEYESKIEKQIKLLEKPENFLNNIEKKDPDKLKLITKYKNLKVNKLKQENYQDDYNALEFYKQLEEHANIALKFYGKIDINYNECPNVEFMSDFKFNENLNKIWKENFIYIIDFCKNIQKNPKLSLINDIFLRTHALEIAAFLNYLEYKIPSFLEGDASNLSEIYDENIIKKIAYKYFIGSVRVLFKEIYNLEMSLTTYKKILNSKEIYENFIEIYNSLKETYSIKEQEFKAIFDNIIKTTNTKYFYRGLEKDRKFKEKFISHCVLNSKVYMPLHKSYLSIKIQEFYINKLKNPENLKALFKINSENILKFEKLLENLNIKDLNNYLNEKDQEVIEKDLENLSNGYLPNENIFDLEEAKRVVKEIQKNFESKKTKYE